MSVKKKQLSVDEMEKVTGGARTFESVPNPDGSGWLKVYVNGVLEATYEYENEMYIIDQRVANERIVPGSAHVFII